MPVLVERWRDVFGYEGLYRVSSQGRVKSLARKVPRGRRTMFLKEKLLTPCQNKVTGYMYVGLTRNGKATDYPVHRIVLEAFVGTRPPGMQCRHFPDRSKSNNRLSNIRWGTVEENAGDRRFHGTVLDGERNPRAKLREADVVAVRAMYRTGRFSQKQIASLFGVEHQSISRIIIGHRWRRVGGEES